MDRDQAQTILRRLANQGCITLSDHFMERMQERGVNPNDVTMVLNWGEISSLKPGAHGGWECRIEGKDSDGEKLKMIIVFNEECLRVFCVTVF